MAASITPDQPNPPSSSASPSTSTSTSTSTSPADASIDPPVDPLIDAPADKPATTPPRVFVAGSLSIRQLDSRVRARIENIVAQRLEIVVGDADGVDTAAQRLLLEMPQARVTVFCTGSPRNNLGRWRVESVESPHAVGSRAYFTAKDRRLAEVADFGLMIWDSRSTGTLGNILELLARGKKTVVFVHPLRDFRIVANPDQLRELAELMSDPARRKAEEKIRLTERIDALRAQTRMFD